MTQKDTPFVSSSSLSTEEIDAILSQKIQEEIDKVEQKISPEEKAEQETIIK